MAGSRVAPACMLPKSSIASDGHVIICHVTSGRIPRGRRRWLRSYACEGARAELDWRRLLHLMSTGDSGAWLAPPGVAAALQLRL